MKRRRRMEDPSPFLQENSFSEYKATKPLGGLWYTETYDSTVWYLLLGFTEASYYQGLYLGEDATDPLLAVNYYTYDVPTAVLTKQTTVPTHFTDNWGSALFPKPISTITFPTQLSYPDAVYVWSPTVAGGFPASGNPASSYDSWPATGWAWEHVPDGGLKPIDTAASSAKGLIVAEDQWLALKVGGALP